MLQSPSGVVRRAPPRRRPAAAAGEPAPRRLAVATDPPVPPTAADDAAMLLPPPRPPWPFIPVLPPPYSLHVQQTGSRCVSRHTPGPDRLALTALAFADSGEPGGYVQRALDLAAGPAEVLLRLGQLADLHCRLAVDYAKALACPDDWLDRREQFLATIGETFLADLLPIMQLPLAQKNNSRLHAQTRAHGCCMLVQSYRHCQVLDLRHHSLGDAHIPELLEHLRPMQGLRVLNLSHNFLTPQGILPLLDGLEAHHPHLVRVRLHANLGDLHCGLRLRLFEQQSWNAYGNLPLADDPSACRLRSHAYALARRQCTVEMEARAHASFMARGGRRMQHQLRRAVSLWGLPQDAAAPSLLVSLRHWAQAHRLFLRRFEDADLSGTCLRDGRLLQVLDFLAVRCPNLRSLDLRDCDIDRASLQQAVAAWPPMPTLRTLRLGTLPLGAATIAALQKLAEGALSELISLELMVADADAVEAVGPLQSLLRRRDCTTAEMGEMFAWPDETCKAPVPPSARADEIWRRLLFGANTYGIFCAQLQQMERVCEQIQLLHTRQISPPAPRPR